VITNHKYEKRATMYILSIYPTGEIKSYVCKNIVRETDGKREIQSIAISETIFNEAYWLPIISALLFC
jgi:hypothetical protein